MKRLIDFVWEGLTLQHLPASRFTVFYIVHYVFLFLFSMTLFIFSFSVLLLYKSIHAVPPFGIWAGILVSASAVCCIGFIGATVFRKRRKQAPV
ncbi:hypothetical protein [Fictibacillus sp. NRS-1165]|uniref:hypothetical protein n=1 Tax=Fictibacillus sp. NRS-1165 TaxID=3144463 RepID=UPI003D23B46F